MLREFMRVGAWKERFFDFSKKETRAKNKNVVMGFRKIAVKDSRGNAI